jgi:DNA polymerase III subunit gamma/tau
VAQTIPDSAPQTGAAQSPLTQHQALYRRWRAQTFADVIAQDAVIETLRNAVRLDRLSHGLLFVGPRGTGKTSTARIVAKAVNCPNAIDGEPDDTCANCVAIREGRALDVVELDAASNNKVDDMRELLPRVYTAPADLTHKVFIIDEVQRIKEGWDVLLKTLEEPPPGVLFIFCTTDPSSIRPAVISRLQRFTFRPLPEGQIRGKLRRIAEAEGRTVTDDALELIAQRAAGGMRDAESMLDQVISSGVETIDADTVRDLLGLADLDTVDRFVADLAGGEALDGIRLLDQLEADGRDLVAFADQVVARLREQLVQSLVEGNRSADRSARLARAARRLAGLDINRGAAGGYRLQLELALLDPSSSPAPNPSHASVSGQASEYSHPPTPRPVAPADDTKPAPATPRPAARVITVEPEPEHTEAPSAQPVQAVAPAAAVATPAAARASTATPAVANGAATSAPAVANGAATSAPAVANGATSAPAAGNAAAPAPAADSELGAVLNAWPEIVARISKNPANKPLIEACRPVEVQGATIVLGFPENKAFLRENAERKKSAFESEIGQVLGRAVAVRCVTSNVELVTAPPAVDLVEQARRVFEDDLVDIAEVE